MTTGCYTVNNETLEGLGESANKPVWRKKVWQIYPKIANMYGDLCNWRIKFGENSTFHQTSFMVCVDIKGKSTVSTIHPINNHHIIHNNFWKL